MLSLSAAQEKAVALVPALNTALPPLVKVSAPVVPPELVFQFAVVVFQVPLRVAPVPAPAVPAFRSQ